MPRSSRRASKRPRQLSPRQVRRPRVRRRQLKQPVRLRQRNLPLERQPLPVGRANLLLRPRLLPDSRAFLFAKSSPEILREKTFVVRLRTSRESLGARDSHRENPSGSETRTGNSRWTVAKSTINDVQGAFVLFLKIASLDAHLRIQARKTRRRGTARQTANAQRSGSREFRVVSYRLRYLSAVGKRSSSQSGPAPFA